MSTPTLPDSLRPSQLSRIAIRVTLIIALIYFLFPVYWLLIASTKSNVDLSTSNGIWFATWNLVDNYDKLMSWHQGHFWRWVANSIFYSTAAGTLGTLISVAAGYAMAKFTFPGRKAFLVLVMTGLLLPTALLTVPLYLMFHKLGLTNTMWAIIIPCAVSPFGVFLGRIYAETVPTELMEAARIDGSGELRIFFSMVLRLLAPAMVTIFLFIFVATWNNFLLPLMMISDSTLKPVTLGLYGMMSYFAPAKGAVMLGALLGVLPLIIMFFALQRFWQAGLAAGSVKG